MNSYITFRKLHRVLVLVMIVATLVMSTTGTLLKYPKISNFLSVDLIFVRTIHNTASPFFGAVLLLMMLSGSVMYFYPILSKRKKSDV